MGTLKQELQIHSEIVLSVVSSLCLLIYLSIVKCSEIVSWDEVYVYMVLSELHWNFVLG